MRPEREMETSCPDIETDREREREREEGNRNYGETKSVGPLKK